MSNLSYLKIAGTVVAKGRLVAPVMTSATFDPQSGKVTLQWSYASKKEVSTVLEKRFDAGSWQEFATELAGVLAIDYVPTSGAGTYDFRAHAELNGRVSEDSENIVTAIVTADQPAPQDLTAFAVSATQVDLSWTPPSPTIPSNQQVERSPSGAGTWSVLTSALEGTDSTYSDTTAVADTAYDYRVAGLFLGELGPYSDLATVTTPAAPSAPAAPSLLTATTQSSSAIAVAWTDNSDNEEFFDLEWSANGTTGWTALVTLAANVTSYTNTGLAPDTTRFYRVKARNSTGSSAYSNVANDTTNSIDPADQPPAAPANLAVASQTSTTADLTWSLLGDNEDTVVVELSTDSTTWQEIDRLPSATASCTIRTLKPAWAYLVRVRTANPYGNSSPSNEATFTTAAAVAGGVPDTPTNLRALAAGDTKVYLDWTVSEASEQETSFTVQRSPAGAGTWGNDLAVPAYKTDCYVTGLTASTAYDFRIRANDSAGSSANSATANATTLAASATWSGLSRDPKCVTPRWYTEWLAEKAAYDAAPYAETDAVDYAKFRSYANSVLPGGTQPYGGGRGAAAAMYVLTGDTSYSDAVYGIYDLRFGTTAAIEGTPSTTVIDVPLAGTSNNTYINRKLWFNSGVNADVSLAHWRVGASSYLGGGLHRLTLVAGQTFPSSPSAGDSVTIYQPATGVYGPNEIRERFIFDARVFDLVYAGLSSAQRTKFSQHLNALSEFACKINFQQYVGGIGFGDSDGTVGYYFGVAIWEALGTEFGNPRQGEFIAILGGFTSTGNTSTTHRNAVNNYARKANGGCWIESTAYDEGTICLWQEGVFSLWQIQQTDNFPEYGPLTRSAAKYINYARNQGNTWIQRWGDVDTAIEGYHQPNNATNAARTQGINARVSPLNGLLTAIVEDFNDDGIAWYDRLFLLFNPSVTAAAYTSMPRTMEGHRPRVHQVHRDGTGVNDSQFTHYCFAVGGVHHSVLWDCGFQLWRKQERALRNVHSYQGATIQEYGVNGVLIGGLPPPYDVRGPAAYEQVQDEYSFVSAASLGSHYDSNYYSPPPGFVHERTRSVVYLPLGDSDVIVAYDRILAANLRKLTKFNRYRRGAQYNDRACQGTPSTTVIEFATASLPARTDNYWNWWLLPKNGANLGADPRQVVSAVTSGATTTLTITPALDFAPASGTDKFDVYVGSDMSSVSIAQALVECVWHMPVDPTLESGRTSWTTPGGQLCKVDHLYPASIDRTVYNERVFTGTLSGTHSTTQVQMTSLPAGDYTGYKLYLSTGGYFSTVTGSSQAGGTTTLTFSAIAGTPVNGNAYSVCEDEFALRAGLNGAIASEQKYQLRISKASDKWPTDTVPVFNEFLNVYSVRDSGSVTTTLITSTEGLARGVLVQATGVNDRVVMFGATRRVLFDAWQFDYTAGTANSTVYIYGLSKSKTWTKNVDGGGATSLTVSDMGVAKITVSGTGQHTIQLGLT